MQALTITPDETISSSQQHMPHDRMSTEQLRSKLVQGVESNRALKHQLHSTKLQSLLQEAAKSAHAELQPIQWVAPAVQQQAVQAWVKELHYHLPAARTQHSTFRTQLFNRTSQISQSKSASCRRITSVFSSVRTYFQLNRQSTYGDCLCQQDTTHKSTSILAT